MRLDTTAIREVTTTAENERIDERQRATKRRPSGTSIRDETQPASAVVLARLLPERAVYGDNGH